MVFVFGSVYVVNYVYTLAYVDPALHPWDESYLIIMNWFLLCCCNQIASILLKIFASMFIMNIGLKFSFLVESLPGSSSQDDVGLIKWFGKHSLFLDYLE